MGPAGLGIPRAFLSSWSCAEDGSLAAVPSLCYSVALYVYVRAGGGLVLGNAPFLLLGKSEEPT